MLITTRKIVCFMCAVFVTIAQTLQAVGSSEDCESRKLNLVFLQDASFSVSDASFQQSKDFIINITRLLPVSLDSVRVALVRFSTGADVISALGQSTNVSVVTEAVDGMKHDYGGTNTAEGLRTVREEVLTEKRPLAHAVVVVITDGASDDRRKTLTEAQRLRREQVRLVWLYITDAEKGQLGGEMERMRKENDTVLEVESFQNLSQETMEQILNASCKEFPKQVITTQVPSFPATSLANPGTSYLGVSNSESSYVTSSLKMHEPQNFESDLSPTTQQSDVTSSYNIIVTRDVLSITSSDNIIVTRDVLSITSSAYDLISTVQLNTENTSSQPVTKEEQTTQLNSGNMSSESITGQEPTTQLNSGNTSSQYITEQELTTQLSSRNTSSQSVTEEELTTQLYSGNTSSQSITEQEPQLSTVATSSETTSTPDQSGNVTTSPAESRAAEAQADLEGSWTENKYNIIGLTVGVCVAAAITAGVVFLVLRRRKKSGSRDLQQSTNPQTSP